MEKTLSQEEVDALLNAVKSGQVAGEEKPRQVVDEIKVQSYNFRRPHLVSSDQLRGFQQIHEAFGKSLQSSLVANLKTPIEIKLVAIDNLSYGEFVLSLLSPTFLVIMNTRPNPGDVVLEMNLSIVLSMIDLMLGGGGTNIPEPRELTIMEQSIVAPLLDYVTNELHSAWLNTADISFAIQSIESDPEFTHVVPPESSVLSATFDLRIGEITGAMNLCYPFEVIQPVLARVTAKMSSRRGRATGTDAERQEILQAISPVPLEMRAEYGKSVILASQLGQLEVGDVICLDKRIDSPVDIFLGDKCCYQADVGVKHGKLAVKIIGLSREVEEMIAAENLAKAAAQK